MMCFSSYQKFNNILKLSSSEKNCECLADQDISLLFQYQKYVFYLKTSPLRCWITFKWARWGSPFKMSMSKENIALSIYTTYLKSLKFWWSRTYLHMSIRCDKLCGWRTIKNMQYCITNTRLFILYAPVPQVFCL